MRALRRQKRNILGHQMTAAGLLLLLLLSTAPAALADSASATLTVSAGSLSESNGTTSPSVSTTLDGTDRVATYTLTLTVTDATGSGNGWKLTITSTQFTTGGGSPHTLPTSASTITGVTASCVASTTCANPINNVIYPVAAPAASSPPTAVAFYNAAANTGMGKFTVTPTVSVSIPANSYAGSYSSTVTLAIVSGP